MRQAREALAGRTVWHVNSTATGGGVAELLRAAIEWQAAAGIDTRWLVPSGDAEFFGVTKRLHHNFHGSAGPGPALTSADRALYARVTRRQWEDVRAIVRRGDLVVLHDPQPLGMAPMLAGAGLHVVWRTHIGTAAASPYVDAAWDFVGEPLSAAERWVFSSDRYIPERLERERCDVIAPSIDPYSVKCHRMAADDMHRILCGIGLEEDGRVHAAARTVQDDPLAPDAPAIVQLSRWDPLKDMAGVLDAFAEFVAPCSDAHLLLAGPDPDDIPDDPENASVFARFLRRRESLAPATRARTHVVLLSLRDLDVNARIVNALQHRAAVVTQKSLQEGFGLAITEAMWKCRPVVASAVGGLREQIVHERSGLLLDDPTDSRAFGEAVLRLLGDDSLRKRLAVAGHRRCCARYLMHRETIEYLQTYLRVVSPRN